MGGDGGAPATKRPDDRGRFGLPPRRAVDGAVLVLVGKVQGRVLLKLYAGGSQDLWDIEQLLAAGNNPDLVTEVGARLERLPPHARQAWARFCKAR